jgi:two-component system phosphate regulon response regulator PhoB
VRSILYRFPDLRRFEQMLGGFADAEHELGLPSGESVEDGEWVLAVFELGNERRATSAAGRATLSPDGAKLVFEPRDWLRLAEFARTEATRPSLRPPAEDPQPSPQTAKSSETEGNLRAPRSPAAADTAPRVLVVDDDADIRDVVCAMLEAVGLVVEQASSAEEGLERARGRSYDLLVLDWNLPKMTGLDLCRTIRKEPNLSALPVLFLTANASSQDMVDAFACGADDYVVKPFRAPELGARIFSLLRRARRAF